MKHLGDITKISGYEAPVVDVVTGGSPCQDFPDNWTRIGDWTDSKGKVHKEADSPRYKALGNSIALPFWDKLAERICEQYDRPVEMASLFDGIGGFPLVFQKHGGKAVWASEIEEFPIAVTKKHFPEEGDENDS